MGMPAVFGQLKIPEQGAYTGAYIDGGLTEDDVTLAKLTAFEKLVGKPQAIIGFSSFWGKGTFPKEQVEAVRQYGAVPLIYWLPWGPPYEQNFAQPDYGLDRIIEGKFDTYIKMWAQQARDAKVPLLVAWGLEMNGTWFPWGGPWHGGSKLDGFGDPKKADGPERYVAAYRHVVDLVRKEGAKNIEWIYHANNFPWPEEKWNSIEAYYPGDDYVDWLGLSVYGMQYEKLQRWTPFWGVIRDPFKELEKLSATKPVILAEWGVGEFPREGSKPEFLREAFDLLKSGYPRIKAAVYWHERWQNKNELYSNLRVNSSPKSLEAYRKGVQDPYWIGRPDYR